MSAEMLDDFRDISGWSAVTSGEAQLVLGRNTGPSGSALRLDYDFKGGGGFVVARKRLARRMPESWAMELQIRGEAPANRLEIKLADPSGRNVWWWHRDAFEVPHAWQPLRVRSSEVSFAWGPAGGGAIRELAAIEIAIAAGPGGRGAVSIAQLCFEDLSLTGPPRVQASSAAPGHEPAQAIDASPATSWRSASRATGHWIALDFGREYEYGGLVIDWEPGAEARAFDVQASIDGVTWTTLWSARQAEGERSYIYLPGGGHSRHLRLHLLEAANGADAFGIRTLDVRPFYFSRSLADFFHAVAAAEPRGHFPRWLHREQSYWTAVGVAGASSAAILNEEGMLEPDRGSFSLEPFLYTDGTLVTWADVESTIALAQNRLPIPSSTWRHRDLALTTTAFAAADPAGPAARACYRVVNQGSATKRVRLFIALRPFQVTPPWQSFEGLGGPARVRSLTWRDGAVVADSGLRVVPLTPPSAFGAAAFEQGGVLRRLVRGELPPRTEVEDDFGFASGALAWDFELAPGAAEEVHVTVPFADRPALGPVTHAEIRAAHVAKLDEVARDWERKLGAVGVRLPKGAAACVDTVRTATAHILINRDGPALQPGPRRYTRSWIRDGATMSAALLRMGCSDEVRDFLDWYARYQATDGNVPCTVDRKGTDWLPEHDSHGEFIFTLAEYFRFTGDRDVAARLWPAARGAVSYLERLRAQRLKPEFREPDKRARFGILPESASHEGYLAQPVHAYWDDFWALRGLGDAVELARALGHAEDAERIEALRYALHGCLYESIETTIATRALSYIPGSVEWADFDPTATATAITTTDAPQRLPAAALAWTFDEYLRGLRRRRNGEIDWNNYSAYELRILGALVRLGRRDDAHEVLAFFLGDRRPKAWNQWPEISWRDPRSPGHLGDVPHAWIGAEFVLAVLALFAYERPADHALVLAAGISHAWLDAGEVGIDDLPTWWGRLRYTMRRGRNGAVELDLAPGLRQPSGGIVIQPPLPRPLVAVEVDGHPIADFDAESVTLRKLPSHVVMRF
jgi:F5/8 type C domain